MHVLSSFMDLGHFQRFSKQLSWDEQSPLIFLINNVNSNSIWQKKVFTLLLLYYYYHYNHLKKGICLTFQAKLIIKEFIEYSLDETKTCYLIQTKMFLIK